MYVEDWSKHYCLPHIIRSVARCGESKAVLSSYLATRLFVQRGGGEGDGVGVVLQLARLEVEVGGSCLVGQAGEAQHALLRDHTPAAVLGTHGQAHLRHTPIITACHLPLPTPNPILTGHTTMDIAPQFTHVGAEMLFVKLPSIRHNPMCPCKTSRV